MKKLPVDLVHPCFGVCPHDFPHIVHFTMGKFIGSIGWQTHSRLFSTKALGSGYLECSKDLVQVLVGYHVWIYCHIDAHSFRKIAHCFQSV